MGDLIRNMKIFCILGNKAKGITASPSNKSPGVCGVTIQGGHSFFATFLIFLKNQQYFNDKIS